MLYLENKVFAGNDDFCPTSANVVDLRQNAISSGWYYGCDRHSNVSSWSAHESNIPWSYLWNENLLDSWHRCFGRGKKIFTRSTHHTHVDIGSVANPWGLGLNISLKSNLCQNKR